MGGRRPCDQRGHIPGGRTGSLVDTLPPHPAYRLQLVLKILILRPNDYGHQARPGRPWGLQGDTWLQFTGLPTSQSTRAPSPWLRFSLCNELTAPPATSPISRTPLGCGEEEQLGWGGSARGCTVTHRFLAQVRKVSKHPPLPTRQPPKLNGASVWRQRALLSPAEAEKPSGLAGRAGAGAQEHGAMGGLGGCG